MRSCREQVFHPFSTNCSHARCFLRPCWHFRFISASLIWCDLPPKDMLFAFCFLLFAFNYLSFSFCLPVCLHRLPAILRFSPIFSPSLLLSTRYAIILLFSFIFVQKFLKDSSPTTILPQSLLLFYHFATKAQLPYE